MGINMQICFERVSWADRVFVTSAGVLDVRMIISGLTTNRFRIRSDVGAKAYSIRHPTASSQLPSNRGYV